ncbi:MAG: hypothetical protein IT316_13280, partial [Anaerolineales bacterium]|nr:hypothetical protein [Anaerolineales bacterium]
LNVILEGCKKRLVSKTDVRNLKEFEAAEAQRQGLEEFKLATNEEMLNAIDAVVEGKL